MGTPVLELTDTVDEPLNLKRGDLINEWIVDNQILSVGFMGQNRAWAAHCSFCGWKRRLHEQTISQGYTPHCINGCGVDRHS